MAKTSVTALVILSLFSAACDHSPLAPSASTAPLQHANVELMRTFATDATCASVEAAGRATGQASVTCAGYSGQMINQGPGCAAHIVGTTTIYFDLTPTVVSVNHWTVDGPINPAQTFTYAGGPVDVPSAGHLGFMTTATWDDVPCR